MNDATNKTEEMTNQVPLWQKTNLTLYESAELTGVGINRLREISNEHAELTLWVNSKRLLKREKLCKFLDEASVI